MKALQPLNRKIKMAMKTNCFILVFSLLFFSNALQAQIEKVIVETYYISDTLDATDTIDGSTRALAAGSKTYRIYIDLVKGSKLKAIYGRKNHPLKITSTANFFNNIDRPAFYFGYQMKKNYFKSNPTLALDSWLTLGLATTVDNGVLKTQDTGVSVINPTHSNTWGGTAGISGGLLVNTNPAAGIPITNKDGLLPNSVTSYTAWFDGGFRNKPSGGRDTTVFGDSLVGNKFISTVAILQQNTGVVGPIADSNQILIAQLTTTGNISFALNITVIDTAGHTIDYIAQKDSAQILSGDTVLAPVLIYPPACGCKDTRYLEYDPKYSCNDSTACKTLKIFGCTDSMACNYNSDANVLLPNFCCYPGYCNDRDISLVCPDLPQRLMKPATGTYVYPNPVQDVLSLQLFASTDDREVRYVIYDSFDRIVVEKDMGMIPGNSILRTDVSDLPKGLYLFRVTVAGSSSIKKFIKN